MSRRKRRLFMHIFFNFHNCTTFVMIKINYFQMFQFQLIESIWNSYLKRPNLLILHLLIYLVICKFWFFFNVVFFCFQRSENGQLTRMSRSESPKMPDLMDSTSAASLDEIRSQKNSQEQNQENKEQDKEQVN